MMLVSALRQYLNCNDLMERVEDLNYSVEILTPEQLITQTPDCLQVTSVTTLQDPSVIQHDVSFKPQANPDEIYVKDLLILHNIKRGLTIFQHENTYEFGRRGLLKSFDLNLDDERSTEFNETLARPLKSLSESI